MTESYEKYLARVLLDESTLQQRIRELGQEISADYAGKGDLLLLCLLKGGVMFLSDLMRHISTPTRSNLWQFPAMARGRGNLAGMCGF